MFDGAPLFHERDRLVESEATQEYSPTLYLHDYFVSVEQKIEVLISHILATVL